MGLKRPALPQVNRSIWNKRGIYSPSTISVAVGETNFVPKELRRSWRKYSPPAKCTRAVLFANRTSKATGSVKWLADLALLLAETGPAIALNMTASERANSLCIRRLIVHPSFTRELQEGAAIPRGGASASVSMPLRCELCLSLSRLEYNTLCHCDDAIGCT